MAKKSRRSRKRQTGARRAGRVSSRPVLRTAPVVDVQTNEQAKPDFREYQYVITDLKRVAILAGAMFALLIALSFFIR